MLHYDAIMTKLGKGDHVCVSSTNPDKTSKLRGLEFLWVILFSCCRKLGSIQKQPVEVFCENAALAFTGSVLVFIGGVHRRFPVKNFANLKGKELVSEYLLNKVARLKLATLSKQRFWHKYFPAHFVKFLGAHKNHIFVELSVLGIFKWTYCVAVQDWNDFPTIMRGIESSHRTSCVMKQFVFNLAK